ncbi:hypothetical protein JMUB7552_27290 [Staphylococcus aureus]
MCIRDRAYKAAEFQGRVRAERFIHLMQNEIIPKRDIITESMICDCIQNAGIDLEAVSYTHLTLPTTPYV